MHSPAKAMMPGCPLARFPLAVSPPHANLTNIKPWIDNTRSKGKDAMAWTTPTLIEICIGLEINGYLPAEF